MPLARWTSHTNPMLPKEASFVAVVVVEGESSEEAELAIPEIEEHAVVQLTG